MGQDDDLQKLRRRLEGDPHDEEARRRTILALLRSGRRDQARELIEGAFRCPLAWEDLSATNAEAMRRCEDCGAAVEFTSEPTRLLELAQEGRCIAAPRGLVAAYVDGLLDDVRRARPLPAMPPCALANDLKLMDLSAWEPSAELLDRREAWLFLSCRAIPVERSRQHILVAAAQPFAPSDARALERGLATSLSQVLARVEDVEEALARLRAFGGERGGIFLGLVNAEASEV